MKLNTQPKTVQDYRDLTKVLKLKIVKQSKQIQQLQSKCKKYEDQMSNSMLTQRQQLNLTKPTDTYITQDQHSTLTGKSQIMRKFLRSTNLFGITPQAIYRIADVHYTNSIQSDYFRTILQKMALNLSPKQISTLIFIFDQNCQGFISREDYHNSLYAYEIAMQGKSLGYMQECLMKFCGLVCGDRVDVGGFYDEMKDLARGRNQKREVDLGVFEQQVKKYFSSRLQQRQIVGAYNQINLQKQRSLQKKNFLYGITSFTNRLSLINDQRSHLHQHTQPSQFKPSSTITNTNSKSRLKSPPIINANTGMSTISINNNQKGNVSGFMNMNNNSFNNNDRVVVSQVDEILKRKEMRYDDVVLAMTQWEISSRLSIHQFKKILKKISTQQFTTEQISIIFKALDINQEGSISIQDTINFTLIHYKDAHLIMMLIGKLLQVTSTTPEEFWNSEQFEDFNKDITRQKFIQVMSQNCSTADPESWQFIWAYFDKGKGNISIQSVVDVWKKYYVQ